MNSFNSRLYGWTSGGVDVGMCAMFLVSLAVSAMNVLDARLARGLPVVFGCLTSGYSVPSLDDYAEFMSVRRVCSGNSIGAEWAQDRYLCDGHNR